MCLQTEIERLKRQIAEKEAAKKAARAQTPTVTKVGRAFFVPYLCTLGIVCFEVACIARLNL